MAQRFGLYGQQAANLVGSISYPTAPANLLFEHLKSSSSGTNMASAASSASTTDPAIYYYTCPVNRRVYLERMCMVVSDASMNAPSKWGASTLANGFLAEIYDTNTTGQLLNFMPAMGIKGTKDMTHLAGIDVTVQSGTGPANDDSLGIRWTFSKAGGSIALTSGQAFRWHVRDDITYLTGMDAMVQGTIWSTT